jgi:predicted DNA-binding transcriptional regulator YafY
MNLFEKIFNYQIISRLEDSGTLLVTAHERGWLKSMLQHDAAADAFTAETLQKFSAILEQDPIMDMKEHFVEKARSREHHVYHPLLRTIKQCIMNKSAIRMTYRIKGDLAYSKQPGFPYKLEYSMVKKEWYLLWYHLRHRAMMSTKLQKIDLVNEDPVPNDQSERLLAEIHTILDKRKERVNVQVIRDYNRELSRILYAFSCFEKEVSYDAAHDTYTIQLTIANNESEYVLSKVRFLGKRVKIVESDKLKQRMYESASKALERYGALE